MEAKLIEEQIRKLLDVYKLRKANSFYIEGDAKGLWFIMYNVNLDHRFNKIKTSIMVKFENNCSRPVILVPNNLKAREDSNVCEYLLKDSANTQGWKLVCTIMFYYIKEDFFNFIPFLGEFLANPRVCYLTWCDEQRAEEKIIEMCSEE